MDNVKALNYWVIGGFEGDKPAEEAMDDVLSMGMDAIELTFDGCIKRGVTEDRCKEIKKAAEDKGVKLVSLATGYYLGTGALSAADEDERKKAVEFTKEYLKVASWLGIDRVLVVAGNVDVGWDPSRPVVPYKTAWESATKSINELIPTAEEYKVIIGLENVWGKFMITPMEYKFFLDQFDSKYVGLYFDTGNATISGYSEHWVELLGDKIVAVHLKNFKRENGGGTLAGFGESLLDGDVNFEKFFDGLKKVGFKGPITTEMIPFSRLPDLVLPDMPLARQTAKDFLELLKY